jgi:hypothetical protein
MFEGKTSKPKKWNCDSPPIGDWGTLHLYLQVLDMAEYYETVLGALVG